MFISGEVNQVSVEGKGGNSIADGLLRLWCRLLNRRPQFPKNALNVPRKIPDVFVDVLWAFFAWFHFLPPPFRASGLASTTAPFEPPVSPRYTRAPSRRDH